MKMAIGYVFKNLHNKKFYECLGGVESPCQGQEILFRSIVDGVTIKENAVWIAYEGKWRYSPLETFKLKIRRFFSNEN